MMALSGLIISLTGGVISQRGEIEAQILENGGHYSAELTRNCTHLVAWHTRGEKFNAAKKWGISVVNGHWLSESLKAKKRMVEDNYQSYDEDLRPRNIPGHPNTPPSRSPSVPSQDSPGGHTRRDQQLEIPPSHSMPPLHTIPPSAPSHHLPPPSSPPSSSRSPLPPLMEESPEKPTPPPSPSQYSSARKRGPEKRRRGQGGRSNKKQVREVTLHSSEQREKVLFRSCCFVMVDFSREDVIAAADTVEQRGGSIMVWNEEESLDRGVAIVSEFHHHHQKRHSSIPLITLIQSTHHSPKTSTTFGAVFVVAKHGSPLPPSIPKKVPIVTPQWIERCCIANHLVEVKSNPMFQPLPTPVPFESMEQQVFAVDGFSKRGRSLMKMMIVIMGGTLAKYSQRVDYLICSSESLLKLKEEKEGKTPKREGEEREEREKGKGRAMLAIESGIPIVSEEWVGECACQGRKIIVPSLDELLKKTERQQQQQRQQQHRHRHQLGGEYGEEGVREREVFWGVSIFVPLTRFENAELLCNISLQLGGVVTMDPQTCTHFISEGPNRRTKDCSEAKNAGAEFVSPLWLFECLSQVHYVDPSHFPPQLKSGRILGDMVITTSNKRKRNNDDPNNNNNKREKLEFTKPKLEMNTFTGGKVGGESVPSPWGGAGGEGSWGGGEGRKSYVVEKRLELGEGEGSYHNFQKKLERDLVRLKEERSILEHEGEEIGGGVGGGGDSFMGDRGDWGRRRVGGGFTSPSPSPCASPYASPATSPCPSPSTAPLPPPSSLPAPSGSVPFSSSSSSSSSATSSALSSSSSSVAPTFVAPQEKKRMGEEEVVEEEALNLNRFFSTSKGIPSSPPAKSSIRFRSKVQPQPKEKEQEDQKEKVEGEAPPQDEQNKVPTAVIVYVDPAEAKADLRLKKPNTFAGNTQNWLDAEKLFGTKPQQDRETEQTITKTGEGRGGKEENEGEKAEEKPHFVLTGFDRKEAEKQGKMIASLGGKWESSASQKTTHVVSAGKLTRTEKIVSGLAKGAWVLTGEFLVKARELGSFPDPSPYQYPVDGDGPSLAAGAIFWREKIAKEKEERGGGMVGAFNGVKGMFRSKGEGKNAARVKSFQRIVHLGGGTTLPYRDLDTILPDEPETNMPTHIFTEEKPEQELGGEEIERWRERGAIVVGVDLITNFLVHQGVWKTS